MRLPIISERPNLFYRKVHNKCALACPPAITFETADELLTITVDFDKETFAAGAVHRYSFREA
jgi:hypothetical protein